MPKKLKVYQTSIGFFDLAVAAPSMKAAAEAWGADADIFRRGFAKPTQDPNVVEATMAAPGVVLRRPVRSLGKFTETAVLPKAPERGQRAPKSHARVDTSKQTEAKKAKRNEAAAFEREKKREALDRAKAEARSERAKKQRERMITKAEAAFARARSRHESATSSIRQRREELDKEEANESQRWEREQQEHVDALKDAEE